MTGIGIEQPAQERAMARLAPLNAQHIENGGLFVIRL